MTRRKSVWASLVCSAAVPALAHAGPVWVSDFEQKSVATMTATVSGAGVTAVTDVAAVGTIDVAGGTTPSSAVRLTVTHAEKDGPWAAAAVVTPESVRPGETDLRKLTLSFMASVSTMQPITVRIESLDAAGRVTGAAGGEVYPAAPDTYQRFAMELSSLNSDGSTAFDPNSPKMRISFGLRGEPGLPAAAKRELRVDNLQLAGPSYYVSPDGDDNADGKTEATALKTPQKAVERAGPGDIVLLRTGEYAQPGDVVRFIRPGTPVGWITVKNAPGETPVLKTTKGWHAVRIGLGSKEQPNTDPGIAYVEIRGLHVIGSNFFNEKGEASSPYPQLLGKVVAETNSNGVLAEGRHSKNVVHHIRIAECVVSGHPGAGIGACFTDWVQIENNTTNDNAWFTNYACSGISILVSSRFDGTEGGYRFLVSGNRASGNRCYQMWTASSGNDAPRKLSDGNGIIIDCLGESNFSKQTGNPLYNGRTLVVNNVSFNNGGSGIHLVSSPNVDLVNNTTYLNGATPEMKYSQMFGYRSPGSNFVNNILVAPEGQKYNLSTEYGEKGNTDVVWSHNVFFGSQVAHKKGVADVLADPQFVKPSRDPKTTNFTLQSDSPASAAGTRSIVPIPLIDINGRRRPLDRNPSIGATEPG